MRARPIGPQKLAAHTQHVATHNASETVEKITNGRLSIGGNDTTRYLLSAGSPIHSSNRVRPSLAPSAGMSERSSTIMP